MQISASEENVHSQIKDQDLDRLNVVQNRGRSVTGLSLFGSDVTETIVPLRGSERKETDDSLGNIGSISSMDSMLLAPFLAKDSVSDSPRSLHSMDRLSSAGNLSAPSSSARRQSTRSNLLERSYTEFLQKWDARHLSMSSSSMSMLFDDDGLMHSSIRRKLTRGMTSFFRSQLTERVEETDKILEDVLKLVEEPDPLNTLLQNDFEGFLRFSQLLVSQSALVHIPDEIDNYVNFKIIYEYAFSRDQTVQITNPLEINQILGYPTSRDILFNFHNNCIVIQDLSTHEKNYYGSTLLAKRRAGNSGIRAGTFEEFWNQMREHFGENELRTVELAQHSLYNIFRVICNNSMVLPYSLLLARKSVEDGQIPPSLESPSRSVSTCDVTKGSTQIDIILAESSTVCSRRDYCQLTNLATNETEEYVLFLTVKNEGQGWSVVFHAFPENPH